MTEPEIARRCSSCGASIREAALFCPQCGGELPARKSEAEKSQAPVASASAEAVPKTTAPLDISDAESQQKPLSETVAIEKSEEIPKPPPTARTRGAVGAQIQRATALARDVEGDVIHRVQKVREISSVVLDEAGYDPSLRFVLVAAVLFVLFLIIVVLNKFIS